MNTEHIYRRSPIWLKTLLLNMKALVNKRRRYTEGYERYLREYIDLWTAPQADVDSYTEDKLRELLIECFEFVPFYRKQFDERAISKEDIQKNPRKALAQMPILSKEDRRSQAQALCNTNPQRPLVETGYTSGTSGSPTVNYQDAESIERGFALWARFHHTLGIKRGDRSIRFSGRLIISPERNKKPFWIHNYAENQLFMSSYHLADDYLDDFIDKINSYQPVYLDGYPSAIYIIANYSLIKKKSITARPKAIMTTAETLYDHQRTAIETAFACPVYNQYASSEGAPFIADCREQRLHMHLDSGLFEVLGPDDQQVGPGEMGRLVMTSFRNLKTPILRYDIKDTVLMPLDNSPCACGNSWPYVEKIFGREDDVLWTPEKGYVGRMDTAYKGLKGILLSQIQQHDPTTFVILNVVDEQYNSQIEERFVANLKDRLGSQNTFRMEYVKEIPLGANGKFHAVKRLFKIPDEA